ncbi:MAG TPA: flagellar export protein FliJ [Lachnospiraceae bacterium]|nr:flagellar export protein FliJ [Lachnospiraceae bacterium]
MAKFRYRMQSILDIKMKLENQAKQDFGAAKAALDLQIDKLEVLKQRKRGYESEAERLLNGELKIRNITDNKAAILRMDDYIRDQKEVVKKAEDKLEEARLKLQQVVQERKTHEKLKEKAFDEFLEEEKRSEGKEVDQLTSYTYGQRKKGNSSVAEKKGEDLNG